MFDDGYNYEAAAESLAVALRRLLITSTARTRIAARMALVDFDTQQGAGYECHFKKHATKLGMDPDWFDRTFSYTVSGRGIRASYRIRGLDMNRPKNSVMLMSKRGKLSWASPKWVAERLNEELAELGKSGTRAIQI